MAISPTIQNSGGAIPNMEDIRALADLVTGANAETVTAANVITAEEHGKTFILNATTGFVSTLPLPADGLKYRFVIGATEVSSGNHTIVPNGSANIIQGSCSTAADGAAVAFVADADSVNFVASAAKNGDYIELWSDGTSWFLSGQCIIATGITSTQV